MQEFSLINSLIFQNGLDSSHFLLSFHRISTVFSFFKTSLFRHLQWIKFIVASKRELRRICLHACFYNKPTIPIVNADRHWLQHPEWICMQWSHILRANFFPVRFLYCNKKPLTSHDLSLCTVSRLTISMHIHTITLVLNFCIIVDFCAFSFISLEFLARKSDHQCNSIQANHCTTNATIYTRNPM